MDARALRRIGALFQEIAEEYEKLAAEMERDPEKAPKRATQKRERARYVPDSIPSELDAARAKAVLRKLGLE
jgi:hypothetical protein